MYAVRTTRATLTRGTLFSERHPIAYGHNSWYARFRMCNLRRIIVNFVWRDELEEPIIPLNLCACIYLSTLIEGSLISNYVSECTSRGQQATRWNEDFGLLQTCDLVSFSRRSILMAEWNSWLLRKVWLRRCFILLPALLAYGSLDRYNPGRRRNLAKHFR